MKLLVLLMLCMGCVMETPPNVDRTQQAKVLNIQGLEALRANKIKEAKANFSLAYELAGHSESLDGLGICEYYLKNYRSSQKLLIKAYEIDGNYYNSLINLALLYETTGYPDLAEKLYQYLIKKYPENYKLQNNFSAFIFDNYRTESVAEVEFRLLQAKSLSPDSIILENLRKVVSYEHKK